MIYIIIITIIITNDKLKISSLSLSLPRKLIITITIIISNDPNNDQE